MTYIFLIFQVMVNLRLKKVEYLWECVSIKLKVRTIDFVISDPKHIMDFILAIRIVIASFSKEE